MERTFVVGRADYIAYGVVVLVYGHENVVALALGEIIVIQRGKHFLLFSFFTGLAVAMHIYCRFFLSFLDIS